MIRFLAEMFFMGIRNLHLHKLRSLLTALGIIIGVAAVIVMVAIGEGAKQDALLQIHQLGAKNVLVKSIPPPESSDASAKQQKILNYGLKRLDLERLQQFVRTPQSPDNPITAIVPVRNTEQNIIHGETRLTSGAIGTSPDIFEIINLQCARGRFWNNVDYNNAAPVCVIGAYTARTLFPYQDPLGETVQVGSARSSVVVMKVVGVLEPTGLRAGSEAASMLSLDPDKAVYFPLSLAQQTFGDSIIRMQAGSFERKQIELSEIWLQADRLDQVEMLAGIAENVVSMNHPNPDYEVKAPIQILRSAEKTQDMFNYIMVGTASLALLVGGIGIMNIMLANVTERTREIGIRRALGAKQRHITLQFLIETVVISLSGGLIGIFLGCSLAMLLPPLVKWLASGNYPTSITSWSVIGSFTISGIVGIGFGMYPAVIAAKMNPIEALRHE